jgi:acetylornithine deacetylase/succinyl-diaminopimelate desuccinylase-like protein
MIVTSSHSDLHSGLYGGYAPSSVNEVVRVLAHMKDENGKILVDGFYEGLDDLGEEILERAKAMDVTEEEYKTASGCNGVVKLPGKTFLEQTGLYPSFEVTGFESGYTGVGFKNIIPHKTEVKFNVRTSPIQNPDKMHELLKSYLKESLPEYVDVEFEYDHGAFGVLIDYVDDKFRVAEFLETAYGEEPIFKYCGGTVPIVTDLKRMFDMPIFLIPFANYDCGMHAANENFDKKLLEKALVFSDKFFRNAQ